MRTVFVPLLLAGALLAQSEMPSVTRWAEGAPNSMSAVKNDAPVKGLSAHDVHVFVNLAEIKDTSYNRVWVQILNHGKSPVDLNPQAAVLLNDDRLNEDRPNDDRSARAVPPDSAAKSIQRSGEAKAQELTSAHCISMSSSGCSPTHMQVLLSRQLLVLANQQAQWVRDNGLQQKTIGPGERALGAIVFKKDGKPADYILRIPIGDQVFEFPVSAQNKAPEWR